MRGHKDDRGSVCIVQQRLRDFHAGVARHADIQEDDVGTGAADLVQRFVAAAGLPHDAKILVWREEHPDALAGQRFIVGDYNSVRGRHPMRWRIPRVRNA